MGALRLMGNASLDRIASLDRGASLDGGASLDEKFPIYPIYPIRPIRPHPPLASRSSRVLFRSSFSFVHSPPIRKNAHCVKSV